MKNQSACKLLLQLLPPHPSPIDWSTHLSHHTFPGSGTLEGPVVLVVASRGRRFLGGPGARMGTWATSETNRSILNGERWPPQKEPHPQIGLGQAVPGSLLFLMLPNSIKYRQKCQFCLKLCVWRMSLQKEVILPINRHTLRPFLWNLVDRTIQPHHPPNVRRPPHHTIRQASKPVYVQPLMMQGYIPSPYTNVLLLKLRPSRS